MEEKMDYKISVSLEGNEDFTTFLHHNIREYNNAHSPKHKEKREENAVKPLTLIVSDSTGKWLGGLYAECYWNWMEIHDFWLHEESRGRGIGTKILEESERIAIKKGVRKALLTTFEFQARSFYESKGYEVVGEIMDYPPGSSYYTMVKTL
ncbi:GNAT family N-acetyltransferase [Rossellomorea marisflavi]|uniref:GNAT family N-acetyltransferase n=1 Tax=Rossellomorea marisflavi TaxID=189381 RepID=UPI003FA08A91